MIKPRGVSGNPYIKDKLTRLAEDGSKKMPNTLKEGVSLCCFLFCFCFRERVAFSRVSTMDINPNRSEQIDVPFVCKTSKRKLQFGDCCDVSVVCACVYVFLCRSCKVVATVASHKMKIERMLAMFPFECCLNIARLETTLGDACCR